MNSFCLILFYFIFYSISFRFVSFRFIASHFIPFHFSSFLFYHLNFIYFFKLCSLLNPLSKVWVLTLGVGMFLYSAIGLEPRRVNTVNIQHSTANIDKSHQISCRGYLYSLSNFRQHNQHFWTWNMSARTYISSFQYRIIGHHKDTVRQYSILLRRPFPCHHVTPLVKRMLGRCLQCKTSYIKVWILSWLQVNSLS